MTSPGRAPRPDASSGTARWLNAVTTLLLAAVALILGAAAGPSILRASIQASDAPDEPAPPVRASRPPLVPRDHPSPRGLRRDLDDDREPVRSPDLRSPPVRPGSGAPMHTPPGLPGTDDDDGPGVGLGLKGGVTLRPLLLRDRRSGSILHEIRAGQSVSILQEDGEWLLVARRTDDDIVTGWARRSELLLR